MTLGGVFAAVVALVAYFTLGMPGMDHTAPAGSTAARQLTALTPSEFGSRIREDRAFVVDVHSPADAIRLERTDAEISYDRIVGDTRLPADKRTPVLLYCETGRMSSAAGRALIEAGYRDVSHLRGGTDAWTRAGLPVDER